MKNLVVEKAFVRENLQAIREAAGGTVIIADLSGNAHGMGILETARILRDDGVRSFGVTEVADAQILRRGGFIEEHIIMLRSTADSRELEELIELNVTCTIGSSEAGVALNGLAKERNTVVEAQIKIDTGFGRYGFMPAEKDQIFAIYKYMSNIVVVGLATRLAPVSRRAAEQLSAFNEVISALEAEGYETGTLYVADSDGNFGYETENLDAVCVGAAFAGRSNNKLKLHKIGYVEAEIEEKGWFKRGNRVGETGMQLRKPLQLAVLSVGWYNGLSVGRQQRNLPAVIRELFGKESREVLVGEKRAKLIYVGKNYMLVDVTNVECSTGGLVRVDIDPVFVKGLNIIYR